MQHDQAIFALAEDYLNAGLLDRAEELLEQIRHSETLSQAALEKLVYIYEREGEWRKAIDTHRRLEILSGGKTPHVAHYYCELAEEALALGDTAAAREYLQSTVRSPSGALRGTLIRARIAGNEQRVRDAAALYKQVIDKDRGFIGEVLPELLACYEQENTAGEFESYIEGLIANDPSLKKELAHAAILGELTRSEALAQCVNDFIAENEILSRLIDVSSVDSLERVASGLRMLALSGARYRCGNCGYGSRQFFWHCPSCKLWESVRPVQQFRLESAVH
jgi:lipopolysaccharide biosynthesis regulator YciM